MWMVVAVVDDEGAEVTLLSLISPSSHILSWPSFMGFSVVIEEEFVVVLVDWGWGWEGLWVGGGAM